MGPTKQDHLRPPISGRYYGRTIDNSERELLIDLRIDVDQRSKNSVVLNRVSGDIFHGCKLALQSSSFDWKIFDSSWVIDFPQVIWRKDKVDIYGTVRFWRSKRVVTTAQISIPLMKEDEGKGIDLNIKPFGLKGNQFKCQFQSEQFRKFSLKIGMCESVRQDLKGLLEKVEMNIPLAKAPTEYLENMVNAFQIPGIDLEVDDHITLIDDTDDYFTAWSAAELHDAMCQYFCRRDEPGQLWSMLAGEYVNPNVAGIIFNTQDKTNMLNGVFNRQGCVLFRNHPWFQSETADSKSIDGVMEPLLDTLAHGLLQMMQAKGEFFHDHLPFDLSATALSKIRDEDLLHLRHGDRPAVVLDSNVRFSSETVYQSAEEFGGVEGNAPLEFLLAGRGYFELMQPVNIEFRLRNVSANPIEIDSQLNPSFGRTKVVIQRPNGRVVNYQPVINILASAEPRELLSKQAGYEDGEDRYSENVYLSFGADGFYFDEPGEYKIKAVYQAPGGVIIPSNVCRIRIGRPLTREEDKLAQDYFSYDTGLAVYFGGSESPFLENGMNTLYDVVDRLPQSRLAAHTNLTLAQNLQRPFYRVDDKQKLNLYRGAKPKEVLERTEHVLNCQKKDDQTLTNLEYHQTRRLRADAMVAAGDMDEAKKELKRMARYLKDHGVNQPIIDGISNYLDKV